MVELKPVLLIAVLLLVTSCASTKFLGTRQAGLAADACALETKQCFMSNNSLTTDGTRTWINGSYSVEDQGDGSYAFSGSVKLEVNNPIIKNIKFLDLTFAFFNNDLVIHEEKIRLKGSTGKYLEFSRVIKPSGAFQSSSWAWYSWRANELSTL